MIVEVKDFFTEKVFILRKSDDDKIQPIPCVSQISKLVGNQASCQHLNQTLYGVQHREDNPADKKKFRHENVINYFQRIVSRS